MALIEILEAHYWNVGKMEYWENVG